MQDYDLDKMVILLRDSNRYKVTEQYRRPEFYNADDLNADNKLIGVFLDIEATGLLCSTDKIIELGMVKFEYTEDGRIFRLLEEFNQYQDPGMPIPQYITKLTGITDDMVQGQQISETEVMNYLEGADLIVSHNAQFDRAFFDKAFPSASFKPWGCSMYDIDWRQEGISSHKLEYIAYKYNFFYEGHRAVMDCLAGIEILAQTLPESKQPVLKQLLTNAQQLRFKLWATNTPYESKDLLRARGYRWGTHQPTNYKAWAVEMTEDKVAAEIAYLRSDIYSSGAINIPVEVFDAYSRFSNCSQRSHNNSIKYQDKLTWVKALCLE